MRASPKLARWSWCCLAVLWLWFGAAMPAAAQAPSDLACKLEPGPSRSVARVIDAATLSLDDRTSVRLLGLLAPRAEDAGAKAGSWPAEQAAEAALKALIEGRTVSLATAGPRRDRYDRALAHVFVGEGEQRIWVQAALVEAGHARVFAPPGAEDCVEALLEREATARAQRRGLWAEAAYQVRPAARPDDIARLRGTFQIVSGRVQRVGGRRGLVTLDLARSGRGGRGVRIVARRSSVEALRSLADPAALQGREVLVRGWIEALGTAPEIEITGAHQLVALPQR